MAQLKKKLEVGADAMGRGCLAKKQRQNSWKWRLQSLGNALWKDTGTSCGASLSPQKKWEALFVSTAFAEKLKIQLQSALQQDSLILKTRKAILILFPSQSAVGPTQAILLENKDCVRDWNWRTEDLLLKLGNKIRQHRGSDSDKTPTTL